MRPLPQIRKSYDHCLVILADGARADVMRDLVRSGKLPAIGDHLVSRGGLKEGVTAFPSTTGPAYLPYLTGCYPGTCNVPGIRWFDKDHYAEKPYSKDRFRSYVGAESFYMNSDLKPEIPTLFEIVPRSANIFSSIHRGADLRKDKTRLSRIWYWYYAHLTDHWGLVDEAATRKILQAFTASSSESPEFVFAVYPAIDEFAHLSSPFHERTIRAYEGLDRGIGKIVQALKARGIWERTMIWIVSDHGLSETQTHFPLNQFLETSGVETLYYPKIVFKRKFDAASMVSGNGMANVYFKNGHGWVGRTSDESLKARKDRLFERFLERPEIDLMLSESEDKSVVVTSRRGEARISAGSDGKKLVYRVQTSDPFGYGKLPENMTFREALEKTDATDYPDGIVQSFQLFRSRRTGDLVLSAAKGNDLRLRYEIHEHKSSHGSLHWEHMKVPIVTNAPLPEGPMRSVDVFPQILSLLGRPVPEAIDGDLRDPA